MPLLESTEIEVQERGPSARERIIEHWSRFIPSAQRALLSNCGWMALGAAALAACQVAWNTLAARALGPGRYGLWSFVVTNTALASTMVGGSIALSANRYVAATRDAQQRRETGYSLVAAAGLAGAAGMMVLLWAGPAIADQILGMSGHAELPRLAGALFAASVLTAAANGILSGSSKFRSVAGVYLVQGVTTLALIAWAVQEGSLRAAVLAATMGAASAAVLAVAKAFSALQGGSSGPRLDPAVGKILWMHAGPSLTSGIVVLCGVVWANVLLIQAGGPSEVAWFNAANQWRALVLFVPSSISPVLVAKLASMSQAGRRQVYASFLNYKVTALLAGLAAMVLILGSPLIVALYGEQFAAARQPLILVGWAFFFAAMNNTAGHRLSSQASHWTSLPLNVVYTGTLLLAVWLCWPALTARVLAGAFLAASAAQWVACAGYWATIFSPSQMKEALLLPAGIAACLGLATAFAGGNGAFRLAAAVSLLAVYCWFAQRQFKQEYEGVSGASGEIFHGCRN